MNSLRRQLDALAAIDPAAPSIEFERTWYSWGTIASAMRSLRDLLAQAGLPEHARVAVVLRNRPESACAMLEVLAADQSLVTLNAMYPDDKLAADVAAVQAPAVVASTQDWQRAGPVGDVELVRLPHSFDYLVTQR